MAVRSLVAYYESLNKVVQGRDGNSKYCSPGNSIGGLKEFCCEPRPLLGAEPEERPTSRGNAVVPPEEMVVIVSPSIPVFRDTRELKGLEKRQDRFRTRLLAKRESYDTDFVIESVLARLGPTEDNLPVLPECGLPVDLKELDATSVTCDPEISSNNPYAVLEDLSEDGCSRRKSLGGKARTLVRWYESFGLHRVRDPPSEIMCGQLRATVRSCFPACSPEWELSFKTVAKVERGCCSNCGPRFDHKLSEWKDLRYSPQEVDEEHLARFADAFRANLDRGWDNLRRPFVPNGHATLSNGRRNGGNWNIEEFSTECSVMTVFSSGKPRIVTLYSSFNTSVLGPLHYSLYSHLKRRGWLLVGDPTDRHIGSLNGADFQSFDYSAATDNIKTAYVRRAIEVLIEMADGLSQDEIKCLRVLGSWGLGGYDGEVERGQPMGSVFSFPLLCLINKTVVDLSLNRLLQQGRIGFSEWSRHRCLVNGDDLLLRNPRKDVDIRPIIVEEGSFVGLVVNQEKSLQHEDLAEVNSTLFFRGKKCRKFNAASVWMDSQVTDVLTFAQEATIDIRSFVKVVRANAHILAKQSDKRLYALPGPLQAACRRDKKIRRALVSLPRDERPTEQGVITMVERPDGYDLPVELEHEAMRDEIVRVRERALDRASVTKARFKTVALPAQRSYNSLLRRPAVSDRMLIPSCYVRRFNLERLGALEIPDVAPLDLYEIPPAGGGSRIEGLIDFMRLGALSRKLADRSRVINDCMGQPVLDFIELVC